MSKNNQKRINLVYMVQIKNNNFYISIFLNRMLK